MKAKLIFDCTDPDDKMELARNLKSLDMILAINDLSNKLRATRKLDKDEVITSEEFYDVLNEYNIVIDELVN